ncbi:hypothetical protein L7F22_060575 [Adiantum nelumboides]|nr:hypothetical protein [Adiantum nelumboides]
MYRGYSNRQKREFLFFNRSEEIRGLERMLTRGDGKLVLMIGLHNFGKSALLQQFMDWQAEHDRGHPILVDMRSGQYSTASSFALKLKAQSTLMFLPTATALLSKLLVQNVAKKALKGLVDRLKSHGRQHLWAFLNWLIMITKQMGVANVILCSSGD